MNYTTYMPSIWLNSLLLKRARREIFKQFTTKKWPLIGWPSWLTNLRPSFWREIFVLHALFKKRWLYVINKLVWGKCNFLRIWLYYITLQKYDRFHLCLMKRPNRMLRNFSYFLEYTKNSWFLFLNECGREKAKQSKKRIILKW